jgi:hypothetical protein
MKKLASVLGILALGGLFIIGCSSQSQIDQATSPRRRPTRRMRPTRRRSRPRARRRRLLVRRTQ